MIRKTTYRRKTRMEQQMFLFQLIDTIIEKHCYVKKYLDKFRVMDMYHNPITNISGRQFLILRAHGIVQAEVKAEVWTCAVEKNPFASASDILLTNKIQTNASEKQNA